MKPFDNLYLIAAVAKFGVIGDSYTTGMLWHCREELKHFRDTTMGSVIVMGRITAETTGKLPGRDCIVLSRDPSYELAGFTTMTIDNFLTYAQRNPTLSFMICGGGEVYSALVDYCRIAIVSRMKLEVKGDITFNVPMEFEKYNVREFEEFTVNYYSR
jgi:dihydrofolate reductase